jgi:GH15 family glucan-1,4-alpha-glucosidase
MLRIAECDRSLAKTRARSRLGLYAEQISRTGRQQGKFPKALTHLALISAALNLDRALG